MRERPRYADAVAVAVIVLVGLVAFGGVGSLEFVLYDDDRYVYDNPMVLAGLSWDGLWWALTTFEVSNWHPVTWLSLMLDVELFGPEPAALHWVNLGWHLCASSLLYAFLRTTTGAWRQSLVVALLFVVHPLHVESVAWVSERKDVLSTTLLLLVLIAYADFVRHRAVGRYVLALGLFAVGLAAKPMLVTVPLLLFLVDDWPLKRAPGLRALRSEPSARARLLAPLLEKIPFAALAVASSLVTLRAQSSGGAVESLAEVSLPLRIGNAFAVIATYFGKTLWPVDLAVPYPHPGAGLAGWRVGLGVLLVVGVLAWMPRARAVTRTGWLWFFVSLIPVIGLVQVGVQAMADRYTYVPHIGLLTAWVWAADAWTQGWSRRWRVVSGVAACVLAAMLAVQTRRQVAVWATTETLFTHALAVTEGNYIAHEKVGVMRATAGDMNAAEQHFRAALELNPGFANAHLKLGEVLLHRGDALAAATHFQRATARRDIAAKAHARLAATHSRLGNEEAVITHYRAAVAIEPLHHEANYNLGVLLARRGELRGAVGHFRAAIAASPTDAMALNNLGFTLMQLGDPRGAVPFLRRAIELDPALLQARGNLKRALAAERGAGREDASP